MTSHVLAHWAATGPRETVVSFVRSESGSAERRSMTRQKRNTARSALRSFSSAPDGLGEAVRLGTTGEPTGVGKGLGSEPGLLHPVRQITRTAVKTHSNKPKPRLHHSPPIDPPSPKESRRSWRSKRSGMLRDANPPSAIAHSWRGNLCITAAPWLTSPLSRSDRTQPVPVGADSSHNVYVARESGDDMTRCTACPRSHDIQAVP